jgi:hypothetical protein
MKPCQEDHGTPCNFQHVHSVSTELCTKEHFHCTAAVFFQPHYKGRLKTVCLLSVPSSYIGCCNEILKDTGTLSPVAVDDHLLS